MNLVEFLFALGAVFGTTSVHFLWTRFVYKLENAEKELDQKKQQMAELDDARIT